MLTVDSNKTNPAIFAPIISPVQFESKPKYVRMPFCDWQTQWQERRNNYIIQLELQSKVPDSERVIILVVMLLVLIVSFIVTEWDKEMRETEIT